MIFNSLIGGNGSASVEWKELPARAMTRAPSRGYYDFEVTFDKLPEGIIIKSTDDRTINAAYCGYIFSADYSEGAMSVQTMRIVPIPTLQGNTLTGTIEYSDIVAPPFMYKEIY